MDLKFLQVFGKYGGVSGLGLFVFFYLFQKILTGKLINNFDWSSTQSYNFMMALMILTFGVTVLCFVAYILSKSHVQSDKFSTTQVLILVVLPLSIIGAVLWIFGRATDQKPGGEIAVEQPAPPSKASSPVIRTYFACIGEFGEKCPSYAEPIGCGTPIEVWVKSKEGCNSFTNRRVYTTGGNQCGYGVEEVTCVSEN